MWLLKCLQDATWHIPKWINCSQVIQSLQYSLLTCQYLQSYPIHLHRNIPVQICLGDTQIEVEQLDMVRLLKKHCTWHSQEHYTPNNSSISLKRYLNRMIRTRTGASQIARTEEWELNFLVPDVNSKLLFEMWTYYEALVATFSIQEHQRI